MRTVGSIVACLLLGSLVGADRPGRTFRVVTPREDGIIATGINGRGEIAGFQWIERANLPWVIEQAPIFARGKEIVLLPVLKGYTATFPAAVSDGGLVVGRASKPAPPGVAVHMRNQAFVWDAKGGIRGLGALEGDSSSIGCGVSRDGRRISGFSIGPNRLRACIWDRHGEAWEGKAMPHRGNLGGIYVPISGDGKHLAGIDGIVPCLWSEDAQGSWSRQEIGPGGSLAPRALNDAGVVVGIRFDERGNSRATVRTPGEGVKPIKEPEGYTKSEANAVNNLGEIVGMVDVTDGSKPRSRAFVIEGGRLRLMDEGGPFFEAATAINDKGEIAGVLESEEDEVHPAKKSR